MCVGCLYLQGPTSLFSKFAMVPSTGSPIFKRRNFTQLKTTPNRTTFTPTTFFEKKHHFLRSRKFKYLGTPVMNLDDFFFVAFR